MPLLRISDHTFHTHVPPRGGVYRIYSLDESDQPRPLQRVLGTDTEGILYIGKSGNLKARVRMLWRVLQNDYKATAHTFGMNYKSLQIIREAFPYDTLALEYEENPAPKAYEKNLLESYRQSFGEVPPLNGSK